MAAGTNIGTSTKHNIFAGSKVSCTTCHGEKIEGEVLAFDASQKIIILKLPSTSGSKGTCNVNFINMDLLQDFSILEETKKHTIPLLSIDMEKVMERHQANLVKRQEANDRIGVGVSPLGQQLFDTIHKQYSCYWDNLNICVRDINVIVVPPYKPENCKGNTKAIDQIKKLVEKFHEERTTNTPT